MLARLILLTVLHLATPILVFGQNLLNNPESVEYDDTHNRYLVSNHGGREIIAIDESGGGQSVFLSGIPGPRGLEIFRDTLYVASDTGIVSVNLETAEIHWIVDNPGWVMVNDICLDSAGNMYATEYTSAAAGGGIYYIDRVALAQELFTAGLEYPNGLYYDASGNRILAVSGAYYSRIWSIDPSDGTATVILTPSVGALDGIVADLNGDFYVSSWQHNAVYRYSPSWSEPPVLISGGHPGPADIMYESTSHTLFIPCYNQDTVMQVGITADLFERVFDGAHVNDGGNSQGVSWADYDNDGYPDLFVTNQSGPGDGDNFLYHNDGDGSFTRMTAGSIVNDGGNSRTATWGDYDNDGDLDVLVANWPTQVNFLYENNGEGTFSRVNSGVIATEVKGSPSAAWADYDRDGLLDLLVSNYGTNSLFHNDGNDEFTKVTAGDISTDVSNSYGASWGDFNDDGYPDLFVAASATAEVNQLYVNSGAGTFSRLTGQDVATDAGESFGGSWGDYDNDGCLDLFVANASYASDGTDFLYHNIPRGTLTAVTEGSVVTQGGYSFGSCWGDFDNDGDLDLFVANAANDPVSDTSNFLYSNNGDGSFTRILDGRIATDGGLSYGAAWADYDRDGDLDLYVAQFRDGIENNYLYRNNGNGKHWINIKCLGTVSNRSAIGTRIRLKAATEGSGVWQVRELSAQTGYCGQNNLNAHFGLGAAAIIDSIEVNWPSGIVQVLTGVDADQFLTITESCCGAYTGGLTGNANCSPDGKLTLSDISRLIDFVYISKEPLCCPENGNTNASPDLKVTLSDISRLIDCLYISKMLTEACL